MAGTAGTFPLSEALTQTFHLSMKIKTLLYMFTIGAAVGLSHPAYAEHHHTKGLTDAVFAKKAAAGGLTEVELGKIAQQNGESQDVKDFGAKMVTDHGKVNDNLKAIAAKDNITIPDKPNAEQQELIDKLGKETGKEFDNAYIRAMVKAHVMDKTLFTEESTNTKNADLKQFADDTLQVITDHLNMIEGIADSHGVATAHHGTHSMAGQPMSVAPMTSGDSGMSKSGVAPGANGNPAPPAATDSASGSAGTAPASGDAGQGKSGVAPGANGNPVPQQ
jgi:putative membrane protein